MRVLIVLLTLLNFSKTFALEIDEKLTIRFLKVSNSKKTILVNRGSEDGLVVGDHAKFFVTSGVVARGVVEKVSPSRSVWSLYRVVDSAEITDDKVLNLKIASAVKITEDPTKSMKDEPIPGGEEKMDVSEEKSASISEAEQSELDGMGLDEKISTSKPSANSKGKNSASTQESLEPSESSALSGSKNWDAWALFHLNSLSGVVTSSDTTASSTGTSASTLDFSAGVEKYFFSSTNFLKEISLVGFMHKRTIDNGQDIKISSGWLEFGGGVNYHFLNTPISVNKIIGFANFNLGVGSINTVETVTSGATSTETSITGSNAFWSLGLGAKYILNYGLGFRAIFDYYSSSESYAYPNDVSVKSTLAGPRMQFGMSYRF